jgi:hypothetical protein
MQKADTFALRISLFVTLTQYKQGITGIDFSIRSKEQNPHKHFFSFVVILFMYLGYLPCYRIILNDENGNDYHYSH